MTHRSSPLVALVVATALGLFLAVAPALAAAVQLDPGEAQIAGITAPQAQETLDETIGLARVASSDSQAFESTTGIGVPTMHKGETDTGQMTRTIAIFLDGTGAVQFQSVEAYTGMSGDQYKAMDDDGWGEQTSSPTYSDVSTAGGSGAPAYGTGAAPPEISMVGNPATSCRDVCQIQV